MEFRELPREIQGKVQELAAQFPFTIEEIVPYYLMGGDHTEKLLCLKTAGVSDQIIELENHVMWNEINKKLWQKIQNM